MYKSIHTTIIYAMNKSALNFLLSLSINNLSIIPNSKVTKKNNNGDSLNNKDFIFVLLSIKK